VTDKPPDRPLTTAEQQALAAIATASDLLAKYAPTQEQLDQIVAQQAAVDEAVKRLGPAYSTAQKFLASIPDTSSILGPTYHTDRLNTRKALEGVVAASTGSAADLRTIGSAPARTDYQTSPVKSGEQYAIERVETAISRLANVAAGSADAITQLAVLSKANLDQQGALVQVLQGLHVTTIEGMRSNDRLQKTMVLLAVIVTMPVLGQFWIWSEPVRSWVLQELNTAFPWP
jgi:hypothetical protein